MDPRAAAYIAAIPPEHRPLFAKVHELILEACPSVEVGFSYKMPAYRVGKRRLHVGIWKHGVSIYGWKSYGDGGLTRHHPELQTSTGTIQLRSDREMAVNDEEIRQLARTVLARSE